MGMKKMGPPAASPAAYVAALSGWRKTLVASLRRATRAAGKLEEEIKWGHLMYSSNGPALYIRAEDDLVYFGFWRGQQLVRMEPRLKPGGRYDMASMKLLEGDKLAPAQVTKLVKAAMALNRKLGDPREAAGTR
jgi:hypothetical protein